MIDAHTHFYPENVAANPAAWAERRGETYWAALVGPRPDGKRSLQGFPSEKKFLEDMDAAGVERAIVQGWYWESPDTCGEANAATAAFAKRHPDRISAFASVQPAFGKRAAETAKRARDDGFVGIGEIHDGVQKFSYAGGSFEQLALACAEESLPVCVHLTEQSERAYLGKVATDFSAAFAAARKFAGVDFIFAHWLGGALFDEIGGGAEAAKLPNVFFDSAANPFVAGIEAWRTCVSEYPDSAIYGSDYPLRLYPRKFKTEEMATIANEARANVPAEFAGKFFSGNIAKIAFGGGRNSGFPQNNS